MTDKNRAALLPGWFLTVGLTSIATILMAMVAGGILLTLGY